jgi:tetratricopeptide (TPR) repeat protein
MSTIFKVFIPLFIIAVFVGCGKTEVAEPVVDLDSLSFAEKVEYHIQNDQYDEAFVLVRGADANDPVAADLLLATHMTYALHLTYGSLTDMRTRMPEALRHYRRVLELDPGNERAKAEIKQIEDIYISLNRDIPEGIAE